MTEASLSFKFDPQQRVHSPWRLDLSSSTSLVEDPRQKATTLSFINSYTEFIVEVIPFLLFITSTLFGFIVLY
jgi:hypothetical protein